MDFSAGPTNRMSPDYFFAESPDRAGDFVGKENGIPISTPGDTPPGDRHLIENARHAKEWAVAHRQGVTKPRPEC